MTIAKAKFHVGQVVHHKLFGYQGVIYDMDPVFLRDDDWYDRVALTRPPENRPWYHVLVHGEDHTPYVAERNLEADDSGDEIEHRLIGNEFAAFEGGRYCPLPKPN